MSVRSVIEIVTHIQSFRNIDLYFQGLYFIKLSIYRLDTNSESKVYAHPFAIDECFKQYQPNNDNNSTSTKPTKLHDPQLLRAAKIIDESSTFHSKCFFIKYSEEEIDLNDFCHFRFEVDLNQSSETGDTDMYLEAELMFYDFLNPVNPPKDKYSEKEKQSKTKQDKQQENNNVDSKTSKDTKTTIRSEERQILEDSKSLCSLKYKIRNVASGIHQFVPLLFQDPNCSVANILIHTIRMDYRFRLIPIQVSEFARMSVEKRAALLEDEETSSKAQRLTVTDALKKQIGVKDYQALYQLLVGTLKTTYEDLLAHYKVVNACCILQKQRITFKKYLQLPTTLQSPEYVANKSMLEQQIVGNNSQDVQYNSIDSEAIIHALLNEANMISSQLFQLWYKYLDLSKISPLFCVEYYKQENLEQICKNSQQFVVPTLTISPDFHKFDNTDLIQGQEQIAKKMRDNISAQASQHVQRVELQQNGQKNENFPIIFEDRTIKPSSKEDQDQYTYLKKQGQDTLDCQEDIPTSNYNSGGIHLFVMVHGLQGNAYDLKNYRNLLNFIHPEAMFLSSMMNEDNTEGDIDELGKTLAKEVTDFVSDNCDRSCLGRISMIGFSLGGLIIRAAVPYLGQFKDKMHTFLSLSSPHLGFMYNPSKIIDVGMWFLKRWKQSMCLKQLTMDDHPDIQQTFLYKLSKSGGLDPFKHICLVSSYQDTYSPYDSARIVMRREAENDALKGKLYNEMSKNILANTKADAIIRLDVRFNIIEKNFDTFVGRAAHIQFLESEALTRILIDHYSELFK